MTESLCKECPKARRCFVACPEMSVVYDKIDQELRAGAAAAVRYQITVFNRAHDPIAFITFPRENIRDFGEAIRWIQRIEATGGHAIIRGVVNNSTAKGVTDRER